MFHESQETKESPGSQKERGDNSGSWLTDEGRTALSGIFYWDGSYVSRGPLKVQMETWKQCRGREDRDGISYRKIKESGRSD